MAYKVKATLDDEKIEGEYEISQLLEKLEEVIEWQRRRER
jgi:hypothetical protein